MSSDHALPRVRRKSAASGALTTFAAEVSAFLDAILHPGRIVGEVQQMGALLVEAQRIEASDPARAEALRSQAARIGH